MQSSKRSSFDMILLALLVLLLPPDAGSFRTHMSETLKVKCDALPFRSTFIGYSCYFSVFQEVGKRNATVSDRNASALCSSILHGAKVAMGVELSNFQLGNISQAKIVHCVAESGNKCAPQETLKSGRCYIRAPTKMNFPEASKFCKSRNMEIPKPASELENRMIRDTLDKGHAWIQKSGYSRWSTCDGTGNATQQIARAQKSKCDNDSASVIDQNGYWSNRGVENLMNVVCVKPAFNELRNVEEETNPCDYQEYSIASDLVLTALPAFPNNHVSKTCYTSHSTTTRYDIMGKATVETQRGCAVLCDTKGTCAGFSFKDDGFSSVCVLLSSSKNPRKCPAQTRIFLKKTSGSRTNITAEFGVDPCIDEIVPWKISSGKLDLPQDGSIIRAVTSTGRRISMGITTVLSTVESSDDMWKLSEKVPDDPNYHNETIVAAVRATAGSSKCKCEPLPYRASRHKSWTSANPWIPDPYPVVTNRLGACLKHPFYLNYKLQHSDIVSTYSGASGITIVCKAGTWFMTGTGGWTQAISEAACIDWKRA